MVGVAGLSALYHHGHRDARFLDRREADEPGEVHVFAVRAKVGGAGFAGDAEVVDFDQSARAFGADDTFHAFPQQACLLWCEAD